MCDCRCCCFVSARRRAAVCVGCGNRLRAAGCHCAAGLQPDCSEVLKLDLWVA